MPCTTPSELQEASDAAAEAYKSWSSTSVMSRQSWLFRFQNLLVANQRRIAESITREQGKTIPDAEGDVLRGMQVVDHACGIPTLLQGETISGIAKDMDTSSYRLPLGVTAGILP